MTVGLTPKTPLSLAVKNPHLTQCVLEPRQCICQMASKSLNYKFIKLPHFIRFVDVSATTAAFIRMTVHHQVSTRRTDVWKFVGPLVSVHRLILFFPDVYRFSDPPVHSVAFSVDHVGLVPIL